MHRVLNNHGNILLLPLFSLFMLSSVMANHSLRFPTSRKNTKTDLIMWENKDESGNRVEYSDAQDWLDHMPEYFELNGYSWEISLLCIKTGIFILYRDEHFLVNKPDDIQVISGIDRCLDPPGWDPPGMGSVRHATSKFFDMDTKSWLTFFTETHYGGLYYTLFTRYTKAAQQYQPAGSIIVMADRFVKTYWLLGSKSGTTTCLDPVYDTLGDNESNLEDVKNHRFWFCLIPNATEFFDEGNGEQDTWFVKGWQASTCSTGHSSTRNLTCYDYLTGELVEPAVAPPPPPPEKNHTTDTGNPTSPFYGLNCTNKTFDELALLIRMRVTNDFGENYQFLLPLDKKHIWRTELIDASFEVVAKLVTPIITPAWFIGSVREYFIYFSEKFVWSLAKGFPVASPNKDVLVALHQTKKCFDKANLWQMLKEIQSTVAGIVNAGPINRDELIDKELRRKEQYDPLMEFVWLSLNLVGTACHQILRYTTNYWLDYVTVASDMYLKPMVDFWRDDSVEEQKYYPIIFGGSNFTRLYDVTAVFTTAVYNVLKVSKVLPRPEILINRRLAPHADAPAHATGDRGHAVITIAPVDVDQEVTTKAPTDAGAPKRKKRQHHTKNKSNMI